MKWNLSVIPTRWHDITIALIHIYTTIKNYVMEIFALYLKMST